MSESGSYVSEGTGDLTTTNNTNNNTANRSGRGNVFVAVSEGRGQSRGSFAVAALYARSLHLELCQFVDSAEFTRLKARIQVADPQEIILGESISEKGSATVLADALQAHFSWVNFSFVHKRFFSPVKGQHLIEHLSNSEVSHFDSSLFDKDLCLSACAALLKFVEHTQNVFFYARSLRIDYCNIEDCCMMDIGSWYNLELLEQSKDKPSLLSSLNFTLTSHGLQLLRTNLLQPSANESVISQRRAAVTDLVQDQHLFEQIRQLLSRMHNLDGVMAVCVQAPKEITVQTAENLLKQLLRLYQTVKMAKSLYVVLAGAELESELLRDKRQSLTDPRLTQIIDALEEKIDPCVLKATKKNSIVMRNQKCYAIKNKISVNLDLARKAYEELLSDIKTQESELKENFTVKDNVRIAFSISRGFHYVWACKEPLRAKLPPIFIREVRNRASITFTSRNTIRYNDRVDQAVSEVMIASNTVILEILDQIRPLVACLYAALDAISCIDFLCSLTFYSVSTEAVCPLFGNQIAIQKGRHPLLELHNQRNVIANDTYLTTDARVAIVTGPNMTGKSTYLKQVCQLCILSQIGCFVPAQFAMLPVLNQIFSRVGHNDILEKNQSGFAVEMAEMASILQHANGQSLVVVDELARSTSVEEGIGISYAITEALICKKSFVFLATHFLELTSLGSTHPAVENYHFETAWRNEENEEDYAHKLMKGPYKGPVYGFELVDLSTFPMRVLDQAREMAERLKLEGENNRRAAQETLRSRLLLRTAHRLRELYFAKKSGEMSNIARSAEALRADLAEALQQFHIE